MGNTTPQLIGLVGLKRSGKDTAAQGLVSECGFVRMAFADPLKEMSMHLRGVWVRVPVDLRYGIHSDGKHILHEFEPYHRVIDILGMEQAKELVPDVRLVLQTLGTDCVRNTLGRRTWTDLTGEHVRHALENNQKVVLTDVRFREEFDLVHELGGINVGIWRGQVSNFAEAARQAPDVHASEMQTYTLLSEVDVLVLNNGSKNYLKKTIIGLAGDTFSL